MFNYFLFEAIAQRLFQPASDRRPNGHWTMEENKNMRLFFDAFAQKRGRDSLIPESWYDITKEDIINEEVCCGGRKNGI